MARTGPRIGCGGEDPKSVIRDPARKPLYLPCRSRAAGLTRAEMLRDPITVCRELCRVGKAGYIETPSRIREIFSKEKQFFARYLLGNFPEIGFHHHRWFVEIEGTHLRFTAKTAALPANRRYYITRGDIGRNLTEQESGLGFFWRGGFTFGEVFVDHGEDYPAFRHKAIAGLKS